MRPTRLAVAFLTVASLVVACAPPARSPCDIAQEFDQVAVQKLSGCVPQKDGGTFVKLQERSVCEANASKCTPQDRENMEKALTCAKGYQVCSPDAGGALSWTFGFGFSCTLQLALVSADCQGVAVLKSDAGM